MNDKQLLELAARAAGHTLVWGGPDKDMARLADTFDNWNPLTDDGDALRLAVKLGMDINIESVLGRTRVNDIYEDHGSDPTAAIRRAIVRAAAEIGSGKS